MNRTYQDGDYTVGVEIESLVRPKEDPEILEILERVGYDQSKSVQPGRGRRENGKAIRKALGVVLLQVEMAANPVDVDDSQYNYDEWSLMCDSSISELDSTGSWSGYYGVEFVSRVLDLGDVEKEIEEFWTVVNKYFDIKPNPSCGTHVHMRPTLGFTLDQLKNVAKATILFDPLVKKLLPRERKDCSWAKSIIQLFQNDPSTAHLVQPGDTKELFQRIESFQDVDSLSEFMSPERSIAWNFQNTLNNCGTIEFRLPPQVQNAESTLQWVAFALSFLANFLSDEKPEEKGFSDFKTVLEHSANKLGLRNSLGDWERMDKSIQTRDLTHDEKAFVLAEKKKKKSKFAEKASRQGSPMTAGI